MVMQDAIGLLLVIAGAVAALRVIERMRSLEDAEAGLAFGALSFASASGPSISPRGGTESYPHVGGFDALADGDDLDDLDDLDDDLADVLDLDELAALEDVDAADAFALDAQDDDLDDFDDFDEADEAPEIAVEDDMGHLIR